MKNQDWKLKYSDLKLKFHDAVDVAFRLGFEQGAQQAQVQQAAQQQADAQAQQAAMMGQDPNSQPGQEGGMPGEEQTDGSELDSHISTLEGMLGSAKPGSPEQAGLQKSLDGIKLFKNELKHKYDLRKSEKAIAAIGKAMAPKFTLSKAATKNMSEPAKKALNMQEKIVDELMKSMAEEETKATESITKTLNLENLLKG